MSNGDCSQPIRWGTLLTLLVPTPLLPLREERVLGGEEGLLEEWRAYGSQARIPLRAVPHSLRGSG